MKQLGIVDVLSAQVATLKWQGHGVLLRVVDDPAWPLYTWSPAVQQYVQIGTSLAGASGTSVGGQAQDPTAVTYNADGSVASYTLNGLNWSIGYNADGTVASETAGALVKTYNYASGKFSGMSGAVNAGETLACTLSTLPANTLAAPGDRRFVSNVGYHAYGATDVGNLGHLFEFAGLTGSGRWVPCGAFALHKRVGTIAAPVASLSSVSAGYQQLVPTGGIALIPPELLVTGNHFRVTMHAHRTGAVAAANLFPKVGQAGTSADTSTQSVSLSGNNTSTRVQFDLWVTSSTTVLVTGSMNNGSNSADGGNGAQELAINAANPLYVQCGISAVSAGDAYQLLAQIIEMVP